MKPDLIQLVAASAVPGSGDSLFIGSAKAGDGTPAVLLDVRHGDVAIRVALRSSESAARVLQTLEEAVSRAWPALPFSPAQCRCDGCGGEAVSGDVFCPAHRESYAAELLGEGGGA